jgi:hypothetical protein
MKLFTNDTKFQVKRSLSIKLDQNRPIIWIGNLPPNVIKIEHPRLYLAMMLETLSTPHTFEELWQKIEEKYPQCSSRSGNSCGGIESHSSHEVFTGRFGRSE